MRNIPNTTSLTSFINKVNGVINHKGSLNCYIVCDKENKAFFIKGYIDDTYEDVAKLTFETLKKTNIEPDDAITTLKTTEFKHEIDLFEYKYNSDFSDFVDEFIQYIYIHNYAGYTLFYDKEEECFALNQHFEGEDKIVLEITFDEIEEANVSIDDAVKMFKAITEKYGADFVDCEEFDDED